MYLFTQVFKENETIKTGGVKLRFKSASFSIDDGYTLLNFYAQRRRTLWQLLEEGKKWIIPMEATCSLNKLPALYNFQTGRGLVWILSCLEPLGNQLFSTYLTFSTRRDIRFQRLLFASL